MSKYLVVLVLGLGFASFSLGEGTSQNKVSFVDSTIALVHPDTPTENAQAIINQLLADRMAVFGIRIDPILARLSALEMAEKLHGQLGLNSKEALAVKFLGRAFGQRRALIVPHVNYLPQEIQKTWPAEHSFCTFVPNMPRPSSCLKELDLSARIMVEDAYLRAEATIGTPKEDMRLKHTGWPEVAVAFGLDVSGMNLSSHSVLDDQLKELERTLPERLQKLNDELQIASTLGDLQQFNFSLSDFEQDFLIWVKAFAHKKNASKLGGIVRSIQEAHELNLKSISTGGPIFWTRHVERKPVYQGNSVEIDATPDALVRLDPSTPLKELGANAELMVKGHQEYLKGLAHILEASIY